MIPTDEMFFSKTEKGRRGKPDVEFLKDHFFRQGRIKEEHALYIIDKATQLLRAEPNVLTVDASVDAPVTGVSPIADLFGSFFDRFLQSAVTSMANK